MCSSWNTLLSIDNSFNLDKYAILKINVKNIINKLVPDNAYDIGEDINEMNKEWIEDVFYNQFAWFYNGIINKNKITYIKDAIRGKDFIQG